MFEDQVACADLVVLSKSDMLDAAARARATASVGEHLPRAVKIVPSHNGRVDPGILLGLGLAVEDDIENRRTRHDDEPDHEHDEFDSFVVELPTIADPETLSRRIKSVADAHDVLRVKGFADVAGKRMRLLVQAVGSRVSYHYDRSWAPDEARSTRLVVIGLKGIDRDAIGRLLAA